MLDLDHSFILFSPEKNIKIKNELMITYPNRHEVFVITKDELGTMSEKTIRLVGIPALSISLFFVSFLFIENDGGSAFILILLTLILSGVVISSFSAYLFIKWYNQVEPYYDENGRLIIETIF